MKRSGDYLVCKTEADSFLETAKWCESDLGAFLLGQMYPFAVNIAFSCELYLKAIMIFDSEKDEFETGHSLKDLYAKLNANDKKGIEAIYNVKSFKKLNELLDESDKTFEQWRYAFEAGVTICVDGMIAFAESLKEYIESTKISV